MFMQVMTFGTELRERLTGYKPQLVESFFFFSFSFFEAIFSFAKASTGVTNYSGEKMK